MFKINNIFKSNKDSQTEFDKFVCESLKISEGKIVNGDIVLNMDCILEGNFSGKMVTTGKVIISKTGKFKGTLQAEDIIVEGFFEGTIICKSNFLAKADAQILAKLSSKTFEFEENVNFNGELNQINIDENGQSPTAMDPDKFMTNFELTNSKNKIKNNTAKTTVLEKEKLKTDSKIRVVKLPVLNNYKKIDNNPEKNNLEIKNSEVNNFEPEDRQSWF